MFGLGIEMSQRRIIIKCRIRVFGLRGEMSWLGVKYCAFGFG